MGAGEHAMSPITTKHTPGEPTDLREAVQSGDVEAVALALHRWLYTPIGGHRLAFHETHPDFQEGLRVYARARIAKAEGGQL